MHQLQLHLPTFEFTPPSSPASLLDTMPWLKRTPQTTTNMPLPPSPTESLTTLEETILSFPSPPSSTPIPTKSTTFPLNKKASNSSLASTRDATRWLFRAPPVRALSAPVSNELGDHFTRAALPSYQETQARLRRRREASQKRVEGMRAWLTSTSPQKDSRSESKGTQTFGRMHQRYDSGSCEHAYGESGVFEEVQDDNASGILLPGLHEDVLWFSLFRLRGKRGLSGGECVGCGEAHADALSDGGAVVWLLHGCGHRVDDRCLDKLRERGATGCHVCERLGVQIGRFGEEEWRARRRRLVDVTGGGV
jgi:hypothetical protein